MVLMVSSESVWNTHWERSFPPAFHATSMPWFDLPASLVTLRVVSACGQWWVMVKFVPLTVKLDPVSPTGMLLERLKDPSLCSSTSIT